MEEHSYSAKLPTTICNSDLMHIFKKVQGNVLALHEEICKILQIEKEAVTPMSLYSKAKRTLIELKRLSKLTNKDKYNEKLKLEFILPSRKQKGNKVDKPQQKNKSQKVECHGPCLSCVKLQKENEKLKNRLKAINVKVLNQKLKRNQRTIQRLQTTAIGLRTKLFLSENSKDKRKKNVSTIGTQCNTIKSEVDNLKKEIMNLDATLLDMVQENETRKTISFRHPDSRGNPYDPRLMQLLHELRRRKIPVQHINPIIKEVLHLVDVSVEELPHPSTIAKIKPNETPEHQNSVVKTPEQHAAHLHISPIRTQVYE